MENAKIERLGCPPPFFYSGNFLRAFLVSYLFLVTISRLNIFSPELSRGIVHFFISIGTNVMSIREETQSSKIFEFIWTGVNAYIFILVTSLITFMSFLGKRQLLCSILTLVWLLLLGHSIGFRFFYIEIYCYAIMGFMIGSILEQTLFRNKNLPTDSMAAAFCVTSLGAVYTTSAISKLVFAGWRWFEGNGLLFLLAYQRSRFEIDNGHFSIVTPSLESFVRENIWLSYIGFTSVFILEAIAVAYIFFGKKSFYLGLAIAVMCFLFTVFTGLVLTSIGLFGICVAIAFRPWSRLVQKKIYYKSCAIFGAALIVIPFLLPTDGPTKNSSILFPFSKFAMFSTLRQQFLFFRRDESDDSPKYWLNELYPKDRKFMHPSAMAAEGFKEKFCDYLKIQWKLSKQENKEKEIYIWQRLIRLDQERPWILQERDEYVGKCIF
jgi:hypothetical protein